MFYSTGSLLTILVVMAISSGASSIHRQKRADAAPAPAAPASTPTPIPTPEPKVSIDLSYLDIDLRYNKWTISHTIYGTLDSISIVVDYKGTVRTFNSCTKCVGSPGIIHIRIPDCNPVSRALMHG